MHMEKPWCKKVNAMPSPDQSGYKHSHRMSYFVSYVAETTFNFSQQDSCLINAFK
jgi:hypothetical protein